MDKIFLYHIREAIKKCKKESISPNEVSSICKDTFKELKKIIDKKGNTKEINQKYEFFEVYFSTFLEYMEIKDIIIRQYVSLLKKYRIVISLLDAEYYESAIIIYRSLYEGAFIIEYLLENSSDKIIDSFKYLSVKRFIESFNVNGSEFYTIYQKLINDQEYKLILEQSEKDRRDSIYGWTGIEKKQIKFDKDILKKLYSDEKYEQGIKAFTVMYRIASEAIHSNNSEIPLNDAILESCITALLDTATLPHLQYIQGKILENDIEKKIFYSIYDIANNEYKEIVSRQHDV